jgi:hypothetical protein
MSVQTTSCDPYANDIEPVLAYISYLQSSQPNPTYAWQSEPEQVTIWLIWR